MTESGALIGNFIFALVVLAVIIALNWLAGWQLEKRVDEIERRLDIVERDGKGKE